MADQLRAAAQQALDYIILTNKSSQFWLVPDSNLNKTVTDLSAALAQAEPVQEQDIEDAIEYAYWHFVARRSGMNEWASAPQSERDAFKAEARKLARGYFPTRQAQQQAAAAELRRLAAVEAERDALLEALKAMLRDPTGCAFCDSGRPRKSVLTGELCEHDDRCGFVLARAAIAKAEGGGNG